MPFMSFWSASSGKTPHLPFGSGGHFPPRLYLHGVQGQMFQQKTGAIGASAALVIAPDCLGGISGILSAFGGEKLENQLGEAMEGDTVIFCASLENPVAEVQKSRERGGVLPNEWGGFEKIAAVGDKVPISGESSQTLHCGEIDR
jgi:hypothetical protein